MAQVPNALVKDLLSTGYFFEQLKSYPKSTEIDIPSYSRDFAIPYLTQMLQSYEGLGQSDRSMILKLAVEHLSTANDDDLVGSILDLKKIAGSEVAINEKALSELSQLEKSEIVSCRQKCESARSLVKLLVSIIRSFKLTEVSAKRDKSAGLAESVEEAMKYGVALSEPRIV